MRVGEASQQTCSGSGSPRLPLFLVCRGTERGGFPAQWLQGFAAIARIRMSDLEPLFVCQAPMSGPTLIVTLSQRPGASSADPTSRRRGLLEPVGRKP